MRMHRRSPATVVTYAALALAVAALTGCGGDSQPAARPDLVAASSSPDVSPAVDASPTTAPSTTTAPKEPPSPSLSDAPAGSTSTASDGERVSPPDEGTYEVSAVEEKPELTNPSDVARAQQRNYPPLLRDAGITGAVHLRYRVLEDGRVDRNSFSITSSTHEAFNDPSIRSVDRARYRPGRVGGRPVKVWVEWPLTWQVHR